MGDGGEAADPDRSVRSAARPTGASGVRGSTAFLLAALGVIAAALAVPTLWVPNGLLPAGRGVGMFEDVRRHPLPVRLGA